MKQIKYSITSFILLIFFQAAIAQTDSTTNTKVNTKAQFKLSVNYNSGLNYYGRTDSLKSTGFFPLAEIWFTPKFYINAAPVFVNNKVQSLEYAGTVTTIGYQHVTNKWLTNIYVLKPFYKQSSKLVQSALKAQTCINLSFLNKVVNITAGGDAKFSDKIDFGVSGGLDHIIKKQFKDNSVLVVDPSFYTYAGTQNFTNTYYQKKSGFLLFPGTNQQVTEHVQQFNILSYEASIPVIYVKGKWMALLTPAYVIPKNLITVPGHPELTERGENLFYVSVGLKYTF
jgi:hypothetical protein